MDDPTPQDFSAWALPDAPCPVRPGLRTATPEEVEAANLAEERKGAARFLEAEGAAEKAKNAKSAVEERLSSWLDHPDDRVPLAFLSNRGLSGDQAVRQVYRRACAQAEAEGVLWSGTLEEIAPYWNSNRYRLESEADGLAERRQRAIAEDGPVALWLDAQSDPARMEGIAQLEGEWRSLLERRGVLSDRYIQERLEAWIATHQGTSLPFFANPRLAPEQALWMGRRVLAIQNHRRPFLRALVFPLFFAGHPLAPGLLDALVQDELADWTPNKYQSYGARTHELPELWKLPLTPRHVQQIVQRAIEVDGPWDRRTQPVLSLAAAGLELPASYAEELRQAAFQPLPEAGGESREERERAESARLRQGVARSALVAFPQSLEREDLLALVRQGVNAEEATILIRHPRADRAVLEQVALRVPEGAHGLALALLEQPEALRIPEVRAYIASTPRVRFGLLPDAAPEEFAGLWRLCYLESAERASQALRSASGEQRGALEEEHWRVAGDDLLHARLPVQEAQPSRYSGARWTTDKASEAGLRALVEIPSALADEEVQQFLLPRLGPEPVLLERLFLHAPPEFALAAFRHSLERNPAGALEALEQAPDLLPLLQAEELEDLQSHEQSLVRQRATLLLSAREARLRAMEKPTATRRPAAVQVDLFAGATPSQKIGR